MFEPLPTAPNLWLMGLIVTNHLAKQIVALVEREHAVIPVCTA